MADNFFDELLPPELKLRVLSFLTLRDIQAVFCVNRANSQIDKDNDFWEYWLRLNFFMQSQGAAKAEYIEMQHRWELEQQLVTTYLAMTWKIISSNYTVDEKQHSLDEIDNALDVLSHEGFLGKANGMNCNFQNARDFYDAMIKNKERARMLGHAATMEAEFDTLSMQTTDYFTSMHFLFMVFAKCNASLTLHLFLNYQSRQDQQIILDKFGTNMLCRAAQFASSRVVRLLLDAKVDPNQYGCYWKEHNLTISITPINALFSLLSKPRRALSKGASIDEIITLLIEHNADFDLPGFTAEDNTHTAFTDLRVKVQQYLGYINRRRLHYSAEEWNMLETLVKKIINAPIVDQTKQYQFLPL